MKKLLYAGLLLLGMSFMFNACEGLGTGGQSGTEVGCWVDEYAVTHYNNEVQEYYEFTKSGLFIDYELHPWNKASATFIDGVIYTPSSYKWEVNVQGKYDITDGVLSVMGTLLGGAEIKIINKDKISIDDDIYLRVKSFSTK